MVDAASKMKSNNDFKLGFLILCLPRKQVLDGCFVMWSVTRMLFWNPLPLSVDCTS